MEKQLKRHPLYYCFVVFKKIFNAITRERLGKNGKITHESNGSPHITVRCRLKTDEGFYFITKLFAKMVGLKISGSA